ncbi:MAG TPA: IPT/TIG domain-containing protein, partial [Acidimicrobiales bacterium]|nr:IPT/TIG domain-containing protein [Acidimicrobiales bacterium]
MVVLPVVGSHPANIAAAAADPVLVVAGDISCGPTDSNFNGSNPSTCQQRSTANLVHTIAPNYLLPGGDTQYNPNFTVGVGPGMSDFTAGYDASWGQLQNPTSPNYVPGLVVRPTPGDHEYGDANENDRGAVGTASAYYQNFGPSGLNDLPASDTGPSSDFYSFDIPVTGGTWHIISLDGECAALPATQGGAPSQSAAGCGAGSPQETFLRNDLAAHQGDCTLIHWHQPAWSEGASGPTDTDYQAFWNDAVQYHVTAIVNGHDHDYERWKPLNASGSPSATGVTEIIAGTGGDSHGAKDFPNSSVVKDDFADFGVLQLTLHATNAAFAFKATNGTIPDSGTMNCQQATGANVPTVTGVSPTSGPTSGTSVAITGTNFTGTTAVRFGAVAATTFQVNSATSITATAPAGSAGAVDVSVTNATGTSATNPSDLFDYVSAPGVVTPVGGALTSKQGAGLSTLAVSPQTLGDVLVVSAQVGTSTVKLSSLSGGGVATWTKAVQFAGTVGFDTEIWFGKVTTTG